MCGNIQVVLWEIIQIGAGMNQTGEEVRTVSYCGHYTIGDGPIYHVDICQSVVVTSMPYVKIRNLDRNQPFKIEMYKLLFDNDRGCVSIRSTNKNLRPLGVDACRS